MNGDLEAREMSELLMKVCFAAIHRTTCLQPGSESMLPHIVEYTFSYDCTRSNCSVEHQSSWKSSLNLGQGTPKALTLKVVETGWSPHIENWWKSVLQTCKTQILFSMALNTTHSFSH